MSLPKKRRRDETIVPSVQRLEELMAVQFDRSVIDDLIEQHTQTVKDIKEYDAPLHCCPRAYEEQYLREPTGSERLCARGKDCEGLQLAVADPFVLREFIYPHQEPQDTQSLCLLCRRFEISYAYYKHETGNSRNSEPPTHSFVRISDHYNLVGVKGEYDVRDCIVSSVACSGLPLPVVLHSRTAYSSYSKDGVKHLAQSRMRCPGINENERGPFLGRRAALEPKVAPSNSLVLSA